MADHGEGSQVWIYRTAAYSKFKWEDKKGEHQEIRFYPFMPKKNLKKYQLPTTAKRANYWMFNYVGLEQLPYFTLYEK